MKAKLNHSNVHTAQVDADKTPEVVALIEKSQPQLVVNTALPYQDLAIMEACLQTGVNYLDTANYEPPDDAHFCYKWQWEYHERFRERKIMALLGCGFDPGVTNIFCTYAQKMHFDQIEAPQTLRGLVRDLVTKIAPAAEVNAVASHH